MSTPRHFLGLDDIPASELRVILDEAHRRKAARKGMSKGAIDADAPCAGKTLALIFEKSSTRTRFSFDMGMRQLGGSSITATSNDLQLGRGEAVDDTAKVLSRFVDGMMLRANRHATLMELARNASVPVINGLTDRSHPCQIMADLQTLEEQGRTLKGLRLTWVGDGNNVAVSFCHAAAKFGFDLTLSTPAGYGIAETELSIANGAGANIILTADPMAAASAADVVIADTFVSMGDDDADKRLSDLSPYQVTDAVMRAADKDALFLHCLPAHRGEEVTASVIDGPHSVIFDEAENRLHAQKAIIKWCFD
ncbi:ornithine carbamoyltransferase [Robiginitomaculum antarcticum]|uniref:ornithine carbamoyltransferase n=1 Tax=Robiginitomaculum antarcticum TaxID=437507 RepID=UPI0003690D6A|nr:ornithine carbamoyltransferase [Robiginitomaculum antarcticum]